MFGKKKADGDIKTYTVKYLGGHPDYPKTKAGGIDFCITEEAFELRPTMGSKGWFKGLAIPYDRVKGLSIEQRQVGTFEGLAGGLNSRQLNQANNIHLTYTTEGPELLLRLEMISGVTVMGQAKKCQELQDLVRMHQLAERFAAVSPPTSATGEGIPDQITRLARRFATMAFSPPMNSRRKRSNCLVECRRC